MERFYAVAYNGDKETGIPFWVRASDVQAAIEDAKKEAQQDYKKAKVYLEDETGEPVFDGSVRH